MFIKIERREGQGARLGKPLHAKLMPCENPRPQPPNFRWSEEAPCPITGLVLLCAGMDLSCTLYEIWSTSHLTFITSSFEICRLGRADYECGSASEGENGTACTHYINSEALLYGVNATPSHYEKRPGLKLSSR
jgi:hypothetical protein